MAATSSSEIRTRVGEVYQQESRRVFATLIRLLGDFDLAEEAMHEAFTAAVESWEREGIPANPRAWLVSTGRFKAIDTIRRRSRFDASLSQLARKLEPDVSGRSLDEETVDDDQLRLIFTCCHPALASEAQVALTLREVCGLQTEEIARAFLTSASTIAQRIVRGKNKIRDAGIPYEVPVRKDLPERLDSVLSVIYLVFNEGYSASSGKSVTRGELSNEAIRLGRLLVDLLPDAEAKGLLALMLLQESRRLARTHENGDLILLENQDRTLWNGDLIREGASLVEEVLSTSQPVGVYLIQAAIASVHAQAATPAETNWPRIVTLYDLLLRAEPSPIVELNRAVAIGMRDGPEAALVLIETLFDEKKLTNFHLAHAARADFCRRLENFEEAARSYRHALELAQQEPEIRFLSQRLNEMQSALDSHNNN